MENTNGTLVIEEILSNGHYENNNGSHEQWPDSVHHQSWHDSWRDSH